MIRRRSVYLVEFLRAGLDFTLGIMNIIIIKLF